VRTRIATRQAVGNAITLGECYTKTAGAVTRSSNRTNSTAGELTSRHNTQEPHIFSNVGGQRCGARQPRVAGPTLLSCYCITVKFKHAAVLVTGVLPGEPWLKRMTPSSLAQKFLTPELL